MVQSTISRSLSIAMLVFQRVVHVTRWSWSGNLLKISKHWRSQRIPDGLKMDKVMQSIFEYGWDCNASGDEKWFLKKCMYSYGEKKRVDPRPKNAWTKSVTVPKCQLWGSRQRSPDRTLCIPFCRSPSTHRRPPEIPATAILWRGAMVDVRVTRAFWNRCRKGKILWFSTDVDAYSITLQWSRIELGCLLLLTYIAACSIHPRISWGTNHDESRAVDTRRTRPTFWAWRWLPSDSFWLLVAL